MITIICLKLALIHISTLSRRLPLIPRQAVTSITSQGIGTNLQHCTVVERLLALVNIFTVSSGLIPQEARHTLTHIGPGGVLTVLQTPARSPTHTLVNVDLTVGP